MTTTIAPADRVIASASFAPEPYAFDPSLIGVIITVSSIRDVVLPEPLRFTSEVRFTSHATYPSYSVGGVDSASRSQWDYNEDETAMVYRYDSGEAVTLPETLPQEIADLVSDFAWSILQDAADAYRAVLVKRGFAR